MVSVVAHPALCSDLDTCRIAGIQEAVLPGEEEPAEAPQFEVSLLSLTPMALAQQRKNWHLQ